MPTSASSDNLPAVAKHDPLFYMETMFVQVQDTLFQVPKIAFEGRQWSYFADAADARREHRRQQSQSPAPAQEPEGRGTPEPQEIEEGSSEAKPIVVDVDVGDFRGLLHVMYAKSSIIQHYPTTINPDQWSSALRLSTVWKFDDIRREAIAALDPTISSWDPLRIIILARECKVRKWLIRAYRQLTLVRINDLEPGWFDGEALGWKTLSRLFYSIVPFLGTRLSHEL
ncbi:hypothetical protein BJ165DRAFT_1530208 [Panaeolus papilionaceus]|nr:hypothetical protein BJ165DRAFT_1530208 [Panaeolus papilionaceus]